jgi:hypothetical protein
MPYSAFIERLLSQPNEASTRRLLRALGIGTDTDSIPEGALNLYFTDERAQDAVAAMLAAGANITLTYDDPTDTLTISAAGGGGGYSTFTVAAGPYAVLATTGGVVVLGNTAGGSFSVTLPTAVGNTAQITIKKIAAANQLTVDAAGAETIDGGLTAVLNNNNESITLISDGANWRII